MEKSKVDFFIQTKGKFFSPEKIYTIRETLEKADDSKSDLINMLNFKNPTTIVLFAVFLGALGIDRFQTGSTGLGILKIAGIFISSIAAAVAANVRELSFLIVVYYAWAIWLIVEMFTASKRAKAYNYRLLMNTINKY